MGSSAGWESFRTWAGWVISPSMCMDSPRARYARGKLEPAIVVVVPGRKAQDVLKWEELRAGGRG
ncbi:hypothetical protein MASR2M79_24390 [Aminivibrio sp.]